MLGPGGAISPAGALLASRGQAGLGNATLLRLCTASALTLTLLAAGVTLAARHGGGLYWLPAAFVLEPGVGDMIAGQHVCGPQHLRRPVVDRLTAAMAAALHGQGTNICGETMVA